MSLALNSLTLEEVSSALEYAVAKPISFSPMNLEDIDGNVFPLLKRKGECKPQQSRWLCSVKLDKTMFASTSKNFNGSSPEVRALVASIKTKLTLQYDLLMYQRK